MKICLKLVIKSDLYMLNGLRLFIILILFIIDLYPDQPHQWCIGQRDRLGCFDRGFETRLCQIKALRIGTIYLRCPVQMLVSGSSFECCTIFAIFFFTIFQTLFIGVWQVNLETKLRRSSSFSSEDAEIAGIIRCRMFSEMSFSHFCDL